jgi:hypothetical protein
MDEPVKDRDYFVNRLRGYHEKVAEWIKQRLAHINPETVIDMLFGPVVYRLMTEHGPLDDAAAEELVDAVFNGIANHKS